MDGGQHSIDREKDIKRDNYLKKSEFYILRFWNNDMLCNHDGVLSEIRKYLIPPSLTLPTSLSILLSHAMA